MGAQGHIDPVCERLAPGHFPIARSGPRSSAGQPAAPGRGRHGWTLPGTARGMQRLRQLQAACRGSAPLGQKGRSRVVSHTERECRFCSGMGSTGWCQLP